MDKKVYESTRYQNIYRHKKNKNYIVMISKPTKTSISSIDGKKIIRLEDALNIRDNPKIKFQKGNEALYKEDFSNIWEKYYNDCKNVQHLAYGTMKKKRLTYNGFLKNTFEEKKLSKISKEHINMFLNDVNTTLKQKNEILKILKAFFNWCVAEDYLLVSPASKIKYFKIEKIEMKYWESDDIKKVLKTLDNDINSNDISSNKRAWLVKILILIEISVGNRIGETRALTFSSFSSNILSIRHSINYDRSSNDFLSNTKTYQSQRDVDITDKLIEAVKEYKSFLTNYTEYDIKDNDLIFFNYATNKPFSDTMLRNKFYYYCEKAEVPKIRMYDLRHTYVALLMAEEKQLYQISGRIGHSNYSTTVNRYGHLSSKKRKEIAEITDKFL